MSQFYSKNNRTLLSTIHKLNCILGSVEDFNDEDVIMEYVLKKERRSDFHLNHESGKEGCESLICRVCNNDRLIVGQAAFFTAVRCVNCDYEITVHEG